MGPIYDKYNSTHKIPAIIIENIVLNKPLRKIFSISFFEAYNLEAQTLIMCHDVKRLFPPHFLKTYILLY